MPALSQSLEFIINTSTTVAITYPNTATQMLTYTSEKAKGDGHYGSSDGFHTVCYTAGDTFVGTITMQASLASEPGISDWFSVADTTVNYTALNIRTTSTVDYFNFTGNFVWVRSKVEIEQGTVEVIHYNH